MATALVKALLIISVMFAVLFVILNALGTAFTGTLSSSWSSGVNSASAFIGPVLIVAMAGITIAIVVYALKAGGHGKD